MLIVTNERIRTPDLPPQGVALAAELHSLFHPVHRGRQWGGLVLETCSTVRNLEALGGLEPPTFVRRAHGPLGTEVLPDELL